MSGGNSGFWGVPQVFTPKSRVAELLEAWFNRKFIVHLSHNNPQIVYTYANTPSSFLRAASNALRISAAFTVREHLKHYVTIKITLVRIVIIQGSKYGGLRPTECYIVRP